MRRRDELQLPLLRPRKSQESKLRKRLLKMIRETISLRVLHLKLSSTYSSLMILLRP
jgi:hypothetical protein